MVRVILAAVVTAALAAAPAAHAQIEPDPGTTRTLGTERGFTAKTWSTQGGRLRCIAVEPLGSSCAGTARRDGPLFISHAVEGDPPRLTAFVIAGLAGSDARSVRVRWTGGTKRIRPGRHGAWFVVLPARARLTDTGIFVRYRGGATRGSDYRGSRRSSRALPGSTRVERTVTDLTAQGGHGLLSWRARGGRVCWYVGDLVQGRVGSRRAATFLEYPINDGGSCTTPAARREPIGLSFTTGAAGPTVVAGDAREDVRSLTLELDDGTRHPLRLSSRRLFAATLDPKDDPAAVIAVLADGTTERLALS